MHDCIFQWMPAEVLPPGISAVRCRCHEDTYATRFATDGDYRCPVSGQVAPARSSSGTG